MVNFCYSQLVTFNDNWVRFLCRCYKRSTFRLTSPLCFLTKGAACIRHSQGIVQCEACADPLLELDQSILQIETSSLSQSPLVAIRESHKIHLLDLVNDGGNNRPLYLGNVRASKLRQLHPNSSVIDMSWLGNGSNELVYVDIDGCVMICNIAIEATKAVCANLDSLIILCSEILQQTQDQERR